MFKTPIAGSGDIDSPAGDGAFYRRGTNSPRNLSLDRTEPPEIGSDAWIMEPRPSTFLATLTPRKRVGEAEDVRKERDFYKRRSERYREKREGLEKKNIAARMALESKQSEIGLLSQRNNKMTLEVDELKKVLTRRNREVTAIRKELDEQHFHMRTLKETLAVKQQNISELTEEISKSTPSVNTVTRDDAYFDAEFSGLAGAIRQWTFRYFRNGPEINHRGLPLRLQETMAATISDYSPVPDRTVVAKDIEASATELIVHWAFRSQLVFRVLGNRRPPMLEDLGLTDRERQELQAQMINMLMRNPKFVGALHTQILLRTSRIYTLFSSLLTAGCDGKCEQALFSILEKAALLGLETSRQVSEFLLPRIQPGSEYVAKDMEDTSDTVDEDDESTGKHSQHFTVQIVLFPPVQRRDLDETGMFIKNPVAVRRAMVTVKSCQE
ncbi:hypothetical protein DFP73DRAFT_531926 [Morchella snyderi]|nr:hypothetical protein DFP73DRAFT_531926 [Morchella snyderi]